MGKSLQSQEDPEVVHLTDIWGLGLRITKCMDDRISISSGRVTPIFTRALSGSRRGQEMQIRVVPGTLGAVVTWGHTFSKLLIFSELASAPIFLAKGLNSG